MKTLRYIAMSACAAVLAACATATPYQPASAPGAFDGFSQTLIENDRARVSFGGNSLTDRETVENYLLYRAAEMTVERGFDHFTLTERDTEEKTRRRLSPSMGYGMYDPFFDYSFYRPRYGWSRGHRYSSFYGPRYGIGYNSFGTRGYGRAGFGFGFGGMGYDPFFNDYDVREITRYRASAEVMFGRGSAPSLQHAFNAREVLENLSSTIVQPDQKM
ncbi:MAG: CC0125/CC1285 family lipoprotein [Maricaulaceae bacterium]